MRQRYNKSLDIQILPDMKQTGLVGAVREPPFKQIYPSSLPGQFANCPYEACSFDSNILKFGPPVNLIDYNNPHFRLFFYFVRNLDRFWIDSFHGLSIPV